MQNGMLHEIAAQILGITGGIATGKSSFARYLSIRMPAEVFDADRCAKELLDTEQAVRRLVRETFGDEVLAADGSLNRTRLREIVFADGEKRRALERILHPAIRGRWRGLAEKKRAANEWLIVDIPLLFETGAGQFFDRIIVVGCDAAVQRRRLLNYRKLSPDMAGKIIATQTDLGVKITKADHMVWNDGPLSALEDQADLLANFLKQRHG